MVGLTTLQLVQLISVRSTVRGLTNQEAGGPPPPGFPHKMLSDALPSFLMDSNVSLN
jgi:hypothetical protein